jgi:hypothetical protein
MRLIQVTLRAGATPITLNSTLSASSVAIQNNAAAVCRVGDNTVSATTGIALAPGATTTQPSLVITPCKPQGIHLSDIFLFGTAGQLIDILYEPAT